MRYLIALVFPPLAVLLCGKPFQAILNFVLTLCCYFPGALHAMLVVSSTNAERRHREHMVALDTHTRAVEQAARSQARKTVQSQAPIAATPVPPPIATPSDDSTSIPVEKKPIGLVFQECLASIANAKESAILAYQELPEWAQPIIWGLSAGTLVSFCVVIVILFRR